MTHYRPITSLRRY